MFVFLCFTFRLGEIVRNHFEIAGDEAKDSRVMIFSQYRDSVAEIVSSLNGVSPMIKVGMC